MHARSYRLALVEWAVDQRDLVSVASSTPAHQPCLEPVQPRARSPRPRNPMSCRCTAACRLDVPVGQSCWGRLEVDGGSSYRYLRQVLSLGTFPVVQP
jgi:hypothetical protein